MISIANNGQQLVSTNDWETTSAKEGLCYLSLNADGLHLLVPNASLGLLPEMRTGKRPNASSLVGPVSQAESTRKCRCLKVCIENALSSPAKPAPHGLISLTYDQQTRHMQHEAPATMRVKQQ